MTPPLETTAVALRPLDVCDPLVAFERLRGDPLPWLLDSALRSERLGRFSFAGSDPYLVMRAWGSRVELDCRRGVRRGFAPGVRNLTADPLEMLRTLLPRVDAPPGAEELPFLGGAVGYLGYELAESIEALALATPNDLKLPDLTLLCVDRVLAWDHVRRRLFGVGLGFGRSRHEAHRGAERAVDELCRALETPTPALPASGSGPRVTPPLPPTFDAPAYVKAVAEVKEEIGAGNVYQACLTQRMEHPYRGDAWRLYRALRRINPAPFACFLALDDVTIVGSSPERFVRVAADRSAESRPIKGTRPRGSDPDADAALRAALEGSAKDRAENLMIVDLVRNDLGRVCEIGSVAVPELMTIESYASVFQMVSTVTGRLREDRDIVDLIRATFPPGSMTGAPKISAMQILGRLERVRRGVYSGAIGYFDARGGADLCVVIRTILLRNGRAYIHSGAGIVADSDPVAEHRESLDKAGPLLAALAECESPG